MGIVYMLIASACFGTMAAMVKAIGPEVPLSQLIFLRCILAAPVLLLVITARGLPAVVRAKKVLFWRTGLGLTALYCSFYALTHLGLAESVFIGRSQPLLLALAAPFVVGERVPRSAWLAIAVGLGGVILIMNPSVNLTFAALVAFVGAAASAGAHLQVRLLNRTDSPLAIVFNFLLISAAITALWALPNFVALTASQWLLVAGIALFASLGQLLMTAAYRRDQAPAVAAATYFTTLLSVLYGYLFWGEIPSAVTWAGGALIIASGLLLVFARFRIKEPPAAG